MGLSFNHPYLTGQSLMGFLYPRLSAVQAYKSLEVYKFCLHFSEEKVHGPVRFLKKSVSLFKKVKNYRYSRIWFIREQDIDSIDTSWAEKIHPFDLLSPFANHHKAYSECTCSDTEMIRNFSFYF